MNNSLSNKIEQKSGKRDIGAIVLSLFGVHAALIGGLALSGCPYKGDKTRIEQVAATNILIFSVTNPIVYCSFNTELLGMGISYSETPTGNVMFLKTSNLTYKFLDNKEFHRIGERGWTNDTLDSMSINFIEMKVDGSGRISMPGDFLNFTSDTPSGRAECFRKAQQAYNCLRSAFLESK